MQNEREKEKEREHNPELLNFFIIDLAKRATSKI